MLTQLLQSECKELLIHHKRLQNDKRELQERLATEEVASHRLESEIISL